MEPLGGGSIHHEEWCLPGPTLTTPSKCPLTPRRGLSQQRSRFRCLRLQSTVNMASRIDWHLYQSVLLHWVLRGFRRLRSGFRGRLIAL
ncbi:hypothetical protein CDAR_99291 [Caerostris darwini]|uniref:Uncharacterized protein n=1 Tax=Caerostris darwini TaxID=1538125 RepID=A0AAV4Q2N3_9ARAC|nr:hypothetical protein CDAR_99291 [Caerostris darwini]